MVGRAPYAQALIAPIASVLCYALGPVGGWHFLSHSSYRHAWDVRFHACHSLLLSSVFVAGWGLLGIAEAFSPWFGATLFREMRLVGMLGSCPVWLLAMISAYGGTRFIAIPIVHELAVKLARHVEHNEERALKRPDGCGSAVSPCRTVSF